jgi:MFS family permease
MHDVHLEPDNHPKDSNVNAFNWFFQMNRYQTFVIVVAALGWLFDTMDQQLFVLARNPAMAELVNVSDITEQDEKKKQDAIKNRRDTFGGYATTIFMLGWATGGLVFGKLGDIIGRAKTMLLTILIYSLCTGLSALSVGFYDFAFYRFITGLGVGGEFAVGVALVAEVMPSGIRTYALSTLQALSAVGNVTAALISLSLGEWEHQAADGAIVLMGFKMTVWRMMFVIGTLPALLALLIRSNLKEPEQWSKSSENVEAKKQAGSYQALFQEKRIRLNAILGMFLAVAGVIGVWGILFYTPELVRTVLAEQVRKSVDPKEFNYELNKQVSIAMLTVQIGAFFGMYSFGVLSSFLGRRPSFAIMFSCAIGSVWLVFGTLKETSQIYWMMPLMGFCLLSVFGGYAIYFPELFPTHLRSTGTSFCYNVGRFISAFGPTLLLWMRGEYLTVLQEANASEPIVTSLRYAALTMSSVYLLGILVLPFLPETRGKPLPD